MSKRNSQIRRRRLIAQLVRGQHIKNQEELREALTQRGIEVSQATLSRDIQNLGVSRRSTEDGYRYHLAGAGPEPSAAPPSGEQRAIKRLATLEAIGVSCNENTVIVYTLTGRASGVGVYLDSLKLPDMLASIAGDDTLLVIPRTIARTEQLREQIAAIFQLD